ncbi:arylsulfatase [Xanthocytophaga agilis]|uniref:Arylsulfatase n=1 Tax=Xanthocytophaga agilis TaxID=3048010 RepID=A0AAE3R081_9BACT|nr:arylsulfatase [Xanthocytophaga agilis]MDJ1501356.1 arylsulfatase [Xanthocytophaga agilis]
MIASLPASRYVIVLLFGIITASFSTNTFAQYDPVQPYKGKTGRNLVETQQWWPDKKKAPEGAPNVVWILLDDVGFGAVSTFGGLIRTPNLDSLANNGLRYTNFHTTAICSPTRAALLTGRNSHSVHMGLFPNTAIGTPGYDGYMPFEKATIAEILRENGYNTYAVGKWHFTPISDATVAGPFNRWPTGRGFDHYYGFLGGSTDQWHPVLWEDTRKVEPETDGKHFTTRIADKAIQYIAEQKSVKADKPFFLYFAPGAGHAPHHVAKEWRDQYKGKFDQGWDSYREAVFKRQQSLGLLPKNAVLPPRQTGVKAWETLTADEKKVFARFMEVYAGFLSYTDYEIGRIVSYLRQNDLLNNTLIVLMIGDNGGSKEGTYTGTIGFADKSQGEDISFLLSQYDKIGTEYTAPNYPLGWSQATNTPFRYWKSDVNAEGASHNPLILYYPNRIKEKGLRTQYSHVVDILPTTIELTGIKIPDFINGYQQRPIQGISLVYSIADAKAVTRHTIQYYELHGGRSIYKDGWKASVYHPRNMFGEAKVTDINFNPPDFSQDRWELYNLNEDWTETKDLAASNPQKLEELKALFDREAEVNKVYPLRNFKEGVVAPEVHAKTVIYQGTTTKTRVPVGKGSISIISAIELPKQNAEGVIFANGGLQGGTSLYILNGKLHYTLTDGIKEVTLTSTTPLVAGKNTIRIDFTNTSAVVLSVNNQHAAEQSIVSKTKYLASIASEGISVGKDLNAPVSKVYPGPYPFTGIVSKIVIEQKVEPTN